MFKATEAERKQQQQQHMFNAIIPAGQGWQFLLSFAFAISLNNMQHLLLSHIVLYPSLRILPAISLVKTSSFS